MVTIKISCILLLSVRRNNLFRSAEKRSSAMGFLRSAKVALWYEPKDRLLHRKVLVRAVSRRTSCSLTHDVVVATEGNRSNTVWLL